jgi:hypothetical protein
MAALIGFGIQESDMVMNTFSEQGRIIRMGSPPMMIELINAVGGVTFEEIWRNKVSCHYGDVPVFFISKSDLLKSKKAAGRPQDIRDLEELDK